MCASSGYFARTCDGAVAQLLVVVVEGVERDRRRARRGASASTIAKAFLRTAGASRRGQRPGDPRQRPLVRVLAQVVERRVHDDRVAGARGIPGAARGSCRPASVSSACIAWRRTASVFEARNGKIAVGGGLVGKALEEARGPPGAARRRHRRPSRRRLRPRGPARAASAFSISSRSARSSRRARAASPEASGPPAPGALRLVGHMWVCSEQCNAAASACQGVRAAPSMARGGPSVALRRRYRSVTKIGDERPGPRRPVDAISIAF